jgi:membrane-bound serine protease (ClpP class)
MPVLGRIVHRTDLAMAHAGGVQGSVELAGMVGREGVALTALRPAGRAEFDDLLLDVVTEGDFVDRGDRVRILDVSGNRVVVARV